MIDSLSEYEMKLVQDADLLLTKNKIIQKVYEVFGKLSEFYKQSSSNKNLPVVNAISAKISRGENYKGLPYVILDYPRHFGKVDVFAVRTFFWWGNFFSITLHLSGQYKSDYIAAVKSAMNQNLFEGWFVSCGDDPWQHHFERDNYTPLQLEKGCDFEGSSYLKLAKKIPLDKWDEVERFCESNFSFLMEVLGS
ncbi:hypothetical protein [Segetibacter sp.]|uniref:hypothetical protein n=1 Tax=Segetibacter sp. TaxID=2231182 RepID=UPI002634EADC|nr:hypothetical protein [Segetibacter sp.]MCW3081597.1 hypothetical protein [Segetibacter sp.]